MRRALLLASLALSASCGKVPIVPVNASFELADASWFDEEDTLFFFWEVRAQQGIGDPSVIDVSWQTDTERVEWTRVDNFDMVHTHVDVDCGTDARCGSASIHVPDEPRNVKIRLRYHEDGELALEPTTVFNVVGEGPPHSNRSLIVYGVFDERNEQVQWRARHLFPTVRNMQASELGLRRTFSVRDQAYGDLDAGELSTLPYGYGEACPGDFTPAGLPPRSTDERAIFDEGPLPVDAGPASMACAVATVTDANGSFETGAIARKNPEVRSSFPELRSPVYEATPLRFFIAECSREVSPEHAAMQRQRLFVDDADEVPTTCADDYRSEAFVDELAASFRAAVEAERPAGNDMVLVIGVHHDDDDMADAVEDALARVVPAERLRNSPRLAGAFVLDSEDRGLEARGLAATTLWCPSTIRLDMIPDASARSCPTLPDLPQLRLGPLSAGTLPILPTREQYLNFIEEFSVGTAGRATELTFLAPELAASAEHVDFGQFGVVTFLNGETLPADPTDAFSYCAPEELLPVVVRSELMQNEEVQQLIAEACREGTIPEAFCTVAESGVLTLDVLGEWHNNFGEPQYELGLFWEFPFLLRMQYEASFAGAVTAFGVSVPFGIASPAESLYGAAAWQAESFSLEPTLSQCTRFCDFPTFDSAGVYQVNAPFRTAYAQACYTPRFPQVGDSGFPLDP